MARSTVYLLLLLHAFLSAWTTDAQKFRSFHDDPTTQLRRLTRDTYEDGISRPTETFSRSNGTLPGARDISNAIVSQHTSIPEPSGLNSLFWSWGQFVDHDMTLVPETPDERYSIEIPAGSTHFGALSELPFKRSGYVQDSRRGPREQQNVITPIIDASMVYGSTAEVADSLRLQGGASPLLEEGRGRFPKMVQAENGEEHFVAGDERVNEQPGLTALHGLFVREHNRLVNLLIDVHGMTDNNSIYETARLLVGSEIQTITAREYLPKIFGNTDTAKLKKFRFRRRAKPEIFNEFATACYRFGHTMVPEEFKTGDQNFCEITSETTSLRDAFFNPELSIDLGMDNIIRGLAINRAEKVDIKLVDSLRNFLFVHEDEVQFGLDLSAFNIQRGRDHGIGNYCDVRRELRLSTKRLTYLSVTGGKRDLSAALERLYGPDPCEMDLWVAGLVEKKGSRRAILGQTCQAVIRRQFENSFQSDPFFVSNIKWVDYGLERDPVLDVDSGLTLDDVNLADVVNLNTGAGLPRKEDSFKTKRCS